MFTFYYIQPALMASKNPHKQFRVSVSLLTVCVHGEGEVGVGLAKILQLFYGQVSELVLRRGRKK